MPLFRLRFNNRNVKSERVKMKEILYEETAFPYDYKRQKVFYIIDKVLMVLSFIVFGIGVFMFTITPMKGDFWWLFPTMIMVSFFLSGLFFFFIKKKFYNCYDYIFVTGDVRIIQVINTKKRKKMIIFDCKDVYGVGRYESETYEKFRKAPGVKAIFAPSNKFVADKPKYYIGATVDGVKYLIILECSEKFLSYILHFSGKQVLEKEF